MPLCVGQPPRDHSCKSSQHVSAPLSRHTTVSLRPSFHFPSQPLLSPLSTSFYLQPSLAQGLGSLSQIHGHFTLALAGCFIWLQLDLLIKVFSRVLAHG